MKENTATLTQPNYKARARFIFLTMILVLAYSTMLFSATIYIDPTNTAANQNGTITNPFNSWSKVTLTSGNIYLQKSGTTFTTTTGINLSGKSGITLGSYGTGNKPRIVASGTGNHIINVSSSSNIIIKGFEVTSTGNWVSGIIIQGSNASSNQVDNCTIYNTQWGIRVVTSSGGTKILNSVIYKTGDDGIYAKDVSTIEIGYCKIYDVNQKYYTNTDQSYSAGDGIQLASVNAMNFNIHNNTIDHSSTGNKFCIIAWGENYSGIIENNIIIGNASKVVSGIYLSPTTGTVTVRYNTIKNSNYGIYSYTKNLDVYYNRFSANKSAINVMPGYALNARNNVFYNNTSVAVSSSSSTSVTLRNNIFNIASGAKAISTQGSLSSNNNLFNVEQSGFINGQSTLSGWKSASGNDAASLVSNPQFISTAGEDFRIQTSSPAINKGASVSLYRDFYGSTVPQSGTPDIGFHEVTGTTTTSNQAPVLNNQSFNISQSSPVGTLVGTVIASDPNAGQSLSYSIVSGNINNAFTIGATTGRITVAGSIPQQNFSLVVKVTDNGSPVMSTQATITITVSTTTSTTNTAPVISNGTFTIAQNLTIGSFVGKVNASDANTGQVLTYSIVSGNTNTTFAINSSTGNITVAKALTLGTFTLTIRATDNGSPVMSSQGTITINVTSATTNKAPYLQAATFTVKQFAPNGTYVGKLVASDPNAGQTLSYSIVAGNTSYAFGVNSSGVIYVRNSSALNISVNPSFRLSVKVTDNGSPQMSFTQTITIKLVYYKSTEVALDIEEAQIQEPKELRVYPNPSVDGKFSVSFGKTYESVKLEVYDISGRLIKNLEVTESSKGIVDMSANPTGAYLIRINTGEETKTLKAIKK